MANLFYNMLLFGIGVQLAAYFTWALGIFGGLITYPLGSATDVTNLNNLFSLNVWSALIGLAGIGISVAALLLRAGTYAIYALLLFALGIFFKIISTFVLAIPNTVVAILSSLNVPALAATPIEVVIGAFVTFAAFIYFAELVVQRRLS